MMRSQMRALTTSACTPTSARALGLNKEDASKLIDLLTDQQLDGFGADARRMDAPIRPNAGACWTRNAPRGPGGYRSFLGASTSRRRCRDYQESIASAPGNRTCSRASSKAADAITQRSQRSSRCTAICVDERKRIPMPQMSDYAHARWNIRRPTRNGKSDYNERVSAQARSILNTEQMTAYSEYQQWQKEMREQFGHARGNAARDAYRRRQRQFASRGARLRGRGRAS